MIFTFHTIKAQFVKFHTPDYKKLQKELTGKKAGTYNKLMERYLANDTTLTLNDYHSLYYGYVFQSGYTASKDSQLRDSLYNTFNKSRSGEADYNAVKSIASIILKDLPFDIRTLDPAIYAYHMLKDESTASKLEFRMGRLIETIYNSGDGLTEQTPFFVISTSNEPDIIRALGFSLSVNAPIQSGNLHYWKVKENEFGVTGFYFRVFNKS